MAFILMSFFYSAGWRYGFMEQFYYGFAERESGFRTSVSNYVSGMLFGDLAFDIKDGVRVRAEWFNSGSVELRDEYGNLVKITDYTFMNLRIYRGNVWVNVHYQPVSGSDVGISMGFLYRFWKLAFRVDNLGIGTPIVAGVALDLKDMGLFLAGGWEYPYGLVWDITYHRPIMGIGVYLNKTNRYDYISGDRGLLSGFAAGLEISRNNLVFRYAIRNLGELGMMNTVEIRYGKSR